MSSQSDFLQRNSFSAEDLQKLKQIMSYRTYEFDRKVEDAVIEGSALNRRQELKRQAYDDFRERLNGMCDE